MSKKVDEVVLTKVFIRNPETNEYIEVSLRVVDSEGGNHQVYLYDPLDGPMKISLAAIRAGAVVIPDLTEEGEKDEVS
jgi:hypothetical protein